MTFIQEYYNLYGLSLYRLHCQDKLSYVWFDVTEDEMFKFFGLLIDIAFVTVIKHSSNVLANIRVIRTNVFNNQKWLYHIH